MNKLHSQSEFFFKTVRVAIAIYNLKKLFEDAIKNIAKNPEVGQVKTGDLSGIYAYGFNYNKIAYRIAYKVEVNEDGTLTIIIMAGVHENFYKKLKEYLN